MSSAIRARLSLLSRHCYSTTTTSNLAKMTKFTLNTTYKLNSGHEIPALGYGV